MASKVGKFIEARRKAEGVKQATVKAAQRAFDTAGAPDGQRAYDAAIRKAHIAYYESVIAAAKAFGIHSGSYEVALGNLRSGAAA